MHPRQRALPQSRKMLALPTPASSSSQSKGSARGNCNNSKWKSGRGKGAAGGKGTGKGGRAVMSFEQIMDMGAMKAFPLFHPSHRELCFKYQKGQRNDASLCKQKHCCIG